MSSDSASSRASEQSTTSLPARASRPASASQSSPRIRLRLEQTVSPM
ncbi:MAG: hypothetical protein AB2807_03735 [Candidatus Sedimenticola endophacoides]